MSSFRTYNNNVPRHLSNYQKETLILKKVYHKTTYISSFRNLTKVIYIYIYIIYIYVCSMGRAIHIFIDGEVKLKYLCYSEFHA